MFERKYTIRDEPWATAATCALLLMSVLIPLFAPRRLAILYAPHMRASDWMSVCVPFLLVAAGIFVLMKLRADDTLRAILTLSFTGCVFFLIWGSVTAITGYTIARGLPIRVPRLVSLNFFYVALVTSAVVVAAAARCQTRLREMDGPGIDL